MENSSDSSSSSNSSSSSSNTSSTSASESTSSDTENSSSSQRSALKSGAGSSESDTPKAKNSKKKHVPKNKANNEVENNKTKEKITNPKTRAKINVSSSESEETVLKTLPKRKVPAKPKATATVTPIIKNNNKKLTSLTKIAKAPPSKLTDKDFQKSNKLKNKIKSIFSPENSSESDDSAPPQKVNPVKNNTTKAIAQAKNKARPKKTENVKTSSSATSSSTSETSGMNKTQFYL